MGEVYRATDTNLKRQVALKVLPVSVAGDAERLARFQLEAQVVAALNHPHIAQIYGLERSGAVTALVLELVDGPTLADRIAEGPIPLDEALPIAKQIAEALEAAHEQGIIHRDLKPANIKVRPDGPVKVLDFGLAKALEPAGGSTSQASLANSPTITSPAMMTSAGVILGTATYMSPEQAKGKPADKRSDIWAFGCVFYEMLTGERAFNGEDIADVLSAVIRSDPRWDRLGLEVPALVRTLLHNCLMKDPRRRAGNMAAAIFALGHISGDESELGQASVLPASAAKRYISQKIPWLISLVAFGVALMAWLPRQAITPELPTRVTIDLGTDASLVSIVGTGGENRATGQSLTLSPNGQLLAFVAQHRDEAPQLYLRYLDQLSGRVVPGTEDAAYPFFSPDGQSVAFFARGKLKKVPVAGGPIVTVCDVQAARGGSWGDDGSIIFTPGPGAGISLMRVPSVGGIPAPLTTLHDDEVTHRWPQVLPGAVGVLYTASSSNTGPFDVAKAVIQPLPTGEPVVVLSGAAQARYVTSGHLVFVRAGTLFAVAFDLKTFKTSGQPAPILGDISYAADNGSAQFVFSNSGRMLYVQGGVGNFRARAIDWFDRDGKRSVLRSAEDDWTSPSLSPDGRRLALAVRTGAEATRDIWLLDWEREATTRLTVSPADEQAPIWTPDGQRVTFFSTRTERLVRNLYWQRVDGSEEAVRLTESPASQTPLSWHPSGRVLAFGQANASTGIDIMLLQLSGRESTELKPEKITSFLATPAREAAAAFSPDGNWIAYTSDETGRSEVYVKPFPGPGGTWQVSIAGGDLPVWVAKRPELIFRAPDNHLMAATFTVRGAAFTSDKPRLWSDAVVPGPFALHPSGDRVAAAAPAKRPDPLERVVMVSDMFGELRRLAPPSK